MSVRTFKTKDKFWTDEAGNSIPYSRVNKVERMHERAAAKILKEALVINKRLVAFNHLISELSQQAFDEYMASKGIEKKTKGNYTWHNFDRSIRIEINVNEPIVFDSLIITAAKEKLDIFLDQNVESKNDFVKAMIHEAFETSRDGNLDTRQVLKLTSYESKINSPLFTEAIKLIRDAIKRPKSKTYRRVWIKDENGKYRNIDLNLSSL